ncbi:HAMP domain-containing sensor histidine kinase [Catellatospora chokoriensis]|uniref:Signal transduction histidine-protein kinase/phosphatase MprB n=1 Tax=Catellatospora chokoriensis TaxID=310353 RepID=A0A8J3K6H2_9ACTN|nr:HAMP domain-containing sensor histidine kinase [Catellatospora chokoriensis]GIF93742.1 two-component sensor histidine kinase [Catellatospora chokoriensis]
MRRPGLRARVTAGFAVGALLVSAAMALLSYQLTERFLLDERERTARRAALFDAGIVRAGLDTDNPEVLPVLRSLDTGANRRALIWRDGEFYSRTVVDSTLTDSLPPSVMSLVEQGKPAVQRTRIAGRPAMVFGIPLGDSTALYEVDYMSELDGNLKVLALVLTLVAAGTAVAGALLGMYSSRRVMRPLNTVADAARDIAGGRLGARLDPATEPDLARLATSFNHMVDQLSARMERDRRFAADVSHELRSPLQTLAAAASVLDRRRDKFDERTATAAGLVVEEVQRFQELVTDLLELARSDQPADTAPVDVAALARQVCRHRGLPASLVTVDTDTSPVWRVDRRRIEQVLANLIDNAQAHGGGVVAVRLTAQPGASVLEVDDEGPGVSAADREAIFDRFVRGRSASARGDNDGTGLGLALVAQHVTAHDGSVQVLDRPGGGARFRIELPPERS